MKKNKFGFTLIEVIIAVAMVAVLAIASVPMMGSYYRSSNMMQLNDTAKSIFLSVQSYLTNEKSAGLLEEAVAGATTVPDKAKLVFDSSVDFTGDTAGELSYFALTKGDTTNYTNEKLGQILDKYLSYKTILQNTIVVEFNPDTGRVFSAQYSEKANGFSYEESTKTNTDPFRTINILNRKQEYRDDTRVGYYGMGSNIKDPATTQLADYAVELVNENRLYLKWSDAEYADFPIGVSINYTINIMDSDKGNALLRSVVVPSDRIEQLKVGEELTTTGLNKSQVSLATTVGTESNEQEYFVYSHIGNDNKRWYYLVLDNIDNSSDEKFSIVNRYSELAMKNIICSVSAYAKNHKPSQAVFSGYEHSMLESVKSSEASNTLSVEYARHLNNLREAGVNDTTKKADSILQTADIDWQKTVEDGYVLCEGNGLDKYVVATNQQSGGAFRSISFESGGVGSNITEALAVPYNGDGKFIKDITILPDSAANSAGLFAKNNTQIGKVKLYNATLNSTGSNVGLLVGENSSDGELLNIEANGTVAGKDSVGGIVGRDRGRGGLNLSLLNTSEITKVNGESVAAVTSNVTGEKYVGGIAGESSNTTGGAYSACNNYGIVTGTNNVGGIVGANKKNNSISACENGGITQITEAVIDANNTEPYKNVGGIAGINEGSITTSKSILVTGVDLNQRPTVRYATKDSRKTIRGENAGGIAGSNSGTIDKCTANSWVVGTANVGGVVGLNQESGKITNCNDLENMTNQTMRGEIFATGDNVGGIVGKIDGSKVKLENFVNISDVYGDKYVGGIVGSNGSEGDAYKKDTLVIQKCQNKGFVGSFTAYAGGITGCNTGDILQCSTDMPTDTQQDIDRRGNIEGLSDADYVGGFAGYNNGMIASETNNPDNHYSTNVSGSVNGNNFVGGIVGHNDTEGVIKFIKVVDAKVEAKGNFVGGFIGLNTSLKTETETNKVSGLAFNAAPSYVKGNNFVGGVIGANLVDNAEGKLNIIANTAKPKGKDNGIVEGKGFVGGIIGYNGIIKKATNETLKDSLAKELAKLDKIDPFQYEDNSTKLNGKTTSIQLSTNMLDVKAEIYVGGIIGYNTQASNLEINTCVNGGDITCNSKKEKDHYFIGGITGRNSGLIEKSSNNGYITSKSKYTGGIVEINEGKIIGCKSTGTTHSTKGNVGGIVGLNGLLSDDERTDGIVETDINKIYMEDCISENTGAVIADGKSTDNVGGLVGVNRAAIKKGTSEESNGNYVRGSVTAANGNYVGGIAGKNKGAGIITGVTVTTQNIIGKNYVGGFVGLNEEEATFSNSTLESGKIKGVDYVGGFVGSNTAKGQEIKGLKNTAKVTVEGVRNVGGIVGNNEGTEITNCVNLATVKATGSGDTDYAGGITGKNAEGKTITNCDNSGKIISNGTYVGGIVAVNEGKLINCRALGGTIEGARSAGGLLGLNGKEGTLEYPIPTSGRSEVAVKELKVLKTNVKSTSDGTKETRVGGLLAENKNITYKKIEGYTIEADVSHINKSTISKNIYVGGIVPVLEIYQTLSDCALKGTVTVENDSKSENDGTGGIVGKNLGKVEKVYLAQEDKPIFVKGTMNVGGIVGRNAGTISDCSNGIADKISVLTVEGSKNIGGFIGINVKEGTSNELISITEWNNYATVKGSENVGGLLGYTRQKVINIEKCENYGKIEGLKPSSTGAVGGIVGRFQPVIGENKDRAVIISCKNHGQITSSVISTGGIVGYIQRTDTLDVDSESETIIENCENYALISSSAQRVGGIAGTAHNNAIITLGTNRGAVTSTVTGNASAAGIVGYLDNNASIYTSNNKANITAKDGSYVGGIAGIAMGITGTKKIYDSNSDINYTITGKDKVGGIMGGSSGTNETNVDIINCKNMSYLKNNGSETGGIVGYLQGSNSKIDSCINGGADESTVLILESKGLSGGIVGSMANSAKVEDCINYSAITESAGKQVGGIAGQIDGTSSITYSKNFGTITQTKAQVGGIVGRANGTTSIIDCVNKPDVESSVSGLKEVGGILGISDGTVTITGCENNAAEVYSLDDSYAIVGGLAGELKGNSKVTKSKNYARVYATKKGNAVAGAVGHLNGGSILIEEVVNYGEVNGARDIGGIVGKVTAASKDAKIKDSVNYGKIERVNRGKIGFTNVDEKYAGRVGGIVGYLTDYSNIEIDECVNFGDVVASVKDENSNYAVSGVGGIVGVSTNWNTLITNCINAAPVYALIADDVGGIIGYNSSKIISCKTTEVDLNSKSMSANDTYNEILTATKKLGKLPWDYQPTKDRKNSYDKQGFLIVGKENVGGIVGNNQSKSDTAITIAILSSGTTRNPVDISKNVFNVKGANNVGGVAGLNIGANILGCYNQAVVNKIQNKDPMNVGGIVGAIRDTTNSISSIKGCFDIGGVRESEGAYIGGLIGFREPTGASRIYDSFTIESKIPTTTVTDITGKWFVGNEPFGKEGYKGMKNDAPFKMVDGVRKNIKPALDSEDFVGEYNKRVEGNEKITMESLKMAIDASNEDNPTDLKAILDNFIRMYPFNIDGPEITSVTRKSNDKDHATNSFTVEWKAVQANIDEYVLTFYDANKLNTGDTNVGDTEVLATTNLDKEHLKHVVEFKNKNDVGKTFYVGIKATSEVKDALDSDETYFKKDGKIQKFRVLPWLPTPKIEETLVEDTTHSFDVSNFGKYFTEGEPKKDFSSIASNGLTSEIYNFYIGDYGVDKIVLTIKDGTAVKGTYEYTLNEAEGRFVPANSWDGTHKFVLGKTETERTFNLEAVAYPKTLNYSTDGLENGYTASSIKKWQITVKQTFKLKTPDVKVVYSGGTTKESTEYTISWDLIENATSYELEISGAEGNSVVEKVAANSPYTYKVLEAYWGKTCTVNVVAKGTTPYTDSDTGEAELLAIKDTKPPDITIIPSYIEPKYTIDWSGYEGGKYAKGTKFDVKISFSENGYEDYQIELASTKDTNFEVDLEGVNIPTNVNLIVEVKAQGIKGETYDSESGNKSKTVYERLPGVSVKTNKRVPGTLKYDVEWKISEGITTNNCSGYIIYRKLSDGKIEQLAMVTDLTATKAQVEFKEGDAGTTVDVWMVAIGKEGVRSSSLADKPASIVVPKRLKSPTNLSVKPAKPADDATALSADAFVKETYTASWTKPEQEDGADYAGYEVNVVATDESIIYKNTINSEATESDVIKEIKAEYAGQKVKVKVRSISTVSLESEWAEVMLTLPKVKLETPTGFKYDEATKKLSVNTVKYAESYEFGIKIGETETQHAGTISENGKTVTLDVTDERLKSGFTATVKAKGDGAYYVNSDTATEIVQVLGVPTGLKFDSTNKKFIWNATPGTTKYTVEVHNIGDKPTDKTTTHDVTAKEDGTLEFELGDMIGVDVRVKAGKPDAAPTSTTVHDSMFTEWMSGSALTVKKEEKTVTVDDKEEKKTFLSFALPTGGKSYSYTASAILSALDSENIKLETATVTISENATAQFEFELTKENQSLDVAYIKLVGTSGTDATLKTETSFIAGIDLKDVTDKSALVVIIPEENREKLKEKFEELEKDKLKVLEIPEAQTKKNESNIEAESPAMNEAEPEQSKELEEQLQQPIVPQEPAVADEAYTDSESVNQVQLLKANDMQKPMDSEAVRYRMVEIYIEICTRIIGMKAA